MTEMVPSIEFD